MEASGKTVSGFRIRQVPEAVSSGASEPALKRPRILEKKGMSQIEKDRQKKRELFLDRVFQESGGTEIGVNAFEISKELGLDSDEMTNAIQYWRGEGLLDFHSMQHVRLTHEGVVAMERVGEGENLVGRRDPQVYSFVNFGSIEFRGQTNLGKMFGNMDQQITQVQDSGDSELAEHLKAFIAAVAKSNDLNVAKKQDLSELLEFVAEQANRTQADRKPSLLGMTLSRIAELVQTSSALSSLWARHGPAIAEFFNLGV